MMKYVKARWIFIVALMVGHFSLAMGQEESSIPDFEEIAAQYEDNASVDSMVADDIAQAEALAASEDTASEEG